jgi:hypothetical protein
MLAMKVHEYGKISDVHVLPLGAILIQFTMYGKYILRGLFVLIRLEVEKN